MANKGKVTAQNSSTTQKGVIQIIPNDTLQYTYNNGVLSIGVKNPTASIWKTTRMVEQAAEEDAKDKTIYLADRANGACTINIENNNQYPDHAEFEVYSLRHGFQISFLNPEQTDLQLRYMDKFSTKGGGKIQSPGYGDPSDNKSWIKMTFYKSIPLWIAQYYSSTEFTIT